jgi:uracil-DNA glycosylase
MDQNSLNYLQALGITAWEQRDLLQIPTISACTKKLAPDLPSLQAEAAACTACALHQSRTQVVFGVGNPQAKLMLIGEAPGFNEDKQGEPFVGRAGQLLNAMLKSVGLKREEIYIANILKCRPPNNRDPLAAEVEECTPFLNEQIRLVQPKLLLALGRIAAHYLLKKKSSLESLRQQKYVYGEQQVPLIVTYHPAYLLRNPIDKKKSFIDLQFIIQTLKEYP